MPRKPTYDKAKIRRLKQTIDPDTGKLYTFARIGELVGCSAQYAELVCNGDTRTRKRRLLKIASYMDEDPQLGEALRRMLK